MTAPPEVKLPLIVGAYRGPGDAFLVEIDQQKDGPKKGQHFVRVRFQHDNGSRQGLAVTLKQLPAFTTAIETALDKARELGLLADAGSAQ
jgi:hypothetical protein